MEFLIRKMLFENVSKFVVLNHLVVLEHLKKILYVNKIKTVPLDSLFYALPKYHDGFLTMLPPS